MGKGGTAKNEQQMFIKKEVDTHFHLSRRKQMLDKYGPDIRALYGADWRSAPGILTAVGIQVVTAIACSYYNLAIWKICVLAYLIGGFCHQSLFFAIHELSHNLVFSWRPANRALAFVANLPLLLPMAISFRKYHMDHHVWLGVEGKDPDLPTRWEVNILRNKVIRAFWAFLQIAVYVFRPAIVMPRKPEMEELYNWVAVLIFDSIMFRFWSWKPLAYLLLSSILGSGYHPAAGHFIAEHYVVGEPEGTTPTDKISGLPQETFSYYGPLNAIMFNGGYHLEHHDHPQIACWNLPKLHKIAPDFYQGLKSYDSWFGVIVHYVFDTNSGAHCRVVREATHGKVDDGSLLGQEEKKKAK